MQKPVIIIGAGVRGKIAAEILTKNNVMIYGFIDDDSALQGKSVYHIPIVGKSSDKQCLELLNEECNLFIAAETPKAYQQTLQLLYTRYTDPPLINVIHPQAILAQHIQLGVGNLIEAGAYIGADVTIDSYSYIASHAVINCGAEIRNFVEVGAHATIQPQASLDHHVSIGASAVVAAGLTIGEGAQIPAHACITNNVAPFTIVPRGAANC